jgi:hypothetical protein
MRNTSRPAPIALYMRERTVEQSAHDGAVAIVERWNATLPDDSHGDFSPAGLGSTSIAPGCGTSRAIYIRTIDRHPLASVGNLVLGLRCSWCPGSARIPAITRLHACPPAALTANYEQ